MTLAFRRKVYLIQEFMEGGPLLKEEYIVEPLAGDVAIAKFIQVTTYITMRVEEAHFYKESITHRRYE